MSKVKLQCWIARDSIGELWLYSKQPTRVDIMTMNRFYRYGGCDNYRLPKDILSNMTFKNSPKRVEVTIDIKDDGKKEGA